MGPNSQELQKDLQRAWSPIWEGFQPKSQVGLGLEDGHRVDHWGGVCVQGDTPAWYSPGRLMNSTQHRNVWQDTQLAFLPEHLVFDNMDKNISKIYLSYCTRIRRAIALKEKFLEGINCFQMKFGYETL